MTNEVTTRQRWSNKPIVVTYQGRALPLRDLCELHHIAFTTVWGRIKKGSSADDAINTPVRLAPGTVVHHARGYAKRSAERRSIHVLMAERAVGHALPPLAEVHHVNGIRDDNRPANLVVCPDHAYHALLHQRQRAMDACGSPDYRKCEICKQWDAPARMYARKSKAGFWHRACGNKMRAERKQRSRNK